MGGSRSREREITPPTTKRGEMTGAPNLNLKDCVGVRSRLEEREGEPPFLFVLDGGRRGGEKMAMGGVGRETPQPQPLLLSFSLPGAPKKKKENGESH